MECVMETGLCNYYGDVCVYKSGERYYLVLGNYDYELGVEISEELAILMINEFKASDKNVGIIGSDFR